MAEDVAVIVRVSEALVADTLLALRAAGDRERVILWFGQREGSNLRVCGVNTPEQESDRDYFRVRRAAILDICGRVAATGQMVAAQIHTHPGRAFHSDADDRWALVRHVGALSLVVPGFAQRTNVGSFLLDTAVYQLSRANRWLPVPKAQLSTVLVIE